MGALPPVTYEGVFNELKATLAAVETLGVTWSNTRFDRYYRILGRAAAATYPRSIDDEAERELLYEALIQGRQLIGASTMWDRLSRKELTAILKTIVKGTDLPPTDPKEEDRARNFLLELSFARYLSLCGFSVELTQGREDLRAEARGHSFSVECKRPTNFDSVRENLKRIKAQLRKRKNILKPANGFAVIGIDRSHALGGLGPVANLDALGRFIDRASQVVADNLTQLAYDVGLMSHAVFGAAVITIATRIEELQQPWTVEQVYVFRLSRKASDLAVVQDCMPLFNHQFGADASNVGR